MGMIPFTLLPLLFYVIAAVFFYDHADYVVEPGQVSLHPYWGEAVLTADLVSGQPWALTRGDVLIIIALVLLLFSILRAGSSRKTSVLGNMVMVLVLCVYIVLFLTLEFAGTSEFFLLTMIAFIDTLATVTLSMVASHSRVSAVPD